MRAIWIPCSDSSIVGFEKAISLNKHRICVMCMLPLCSPTVVVACGCLFVYYVFGGCVSVLFGVLGYEYAFVDFWVCRSSCVNVFYI